MSSYLPAEFGCEDLILTALHELLTEKCQTELETGDVTRAGLVKVGPAQATPEGVSLLIHENDPDEPARWPHRPMKYRSLSPAGGLSGDVYSEAMSLRTTPGRTLIGGGSMYSRAYTLEIEVFGIYLPTGVDIDREEVRRISSAVTRRAYRAIPEAGPTIGTDRAIQADFGEMIVDGPFMDQSWTDPGEGESLIVRKYLRFWYRTAMEWSTDGW